MPRTPEAERQQELGGRRWLSLGLALAHGLDDGVRGSCGCRFDFVQYRFVSTRTCGLPLRSLAVSLSPSTPNQAARGPNGSLSVGSESKAPRRIGSTSSFSTSLCSHNSDSDGRRFLQYSSLLSQTARAPRVHGHRSSGTACTAKRLQNRLTAQFKRSNRSHTSS